MEVKFGRTRSSVTVTDVVQAPTDADHGSLVQERLAAKQQTHSRGAVLGLNLCAVSSVGTKESVSGKLLRKVGHRNPNREK